MKHKIFFFYTILLLPALVLLSIMFATGRDLYEIQKIDPAEIYRDLVEVAPRRNPLSFPLPDTIDIKDRSRKTVFMFGESSLLLSDSGRTFPDYLEQNHQDIRVVNLGISGIDSLAIRQRVAEALSVTRPDIIILYYGHNDYTVAYQHYILPKYFSQFDCLLKLPYMFYDEKKPVSSFSLGDYYTYSRLHRPRLLQFFQKLGIITIRQEGFAAINNLILDRYIQNNEAIIDMAAAQKIPVVLITPVGNLRAEPYGDIKTTTALFKKGMAATDYLASLEYLKKARDAEITTYDLRAKSPLVAHVRNFRRPDVYVLDLEKRLEEMHFGFGHPEFVDYFHLKDGSHRLIADIIYAFMKQNNLVQKGTKSPQAAL